ncbi:prephenate dehydrogenase [Stenotrophomonas maltophilia]|jgi:prephenate dehydrogenase|uniref:prephenate dehydrogenase n=1 Tax=Stenotrophomonas maltophilia TaxID=40324 RepID=UPI0021C7AB29|nr:prephenate dehydrogenase [Stenotrophomonas maltophilia]MCU1092897.1 prephenate dehydrogenase [Stenotrophomonas maltophilia]UXY49740.1 prephenate dehydrogenase [Stenotrophomonas maltophilia]HEL3866377.1 prephenate dehydrogenase [Stenotrophomonas maltophilia]HEL4259822.1 prephenate dehydrogenase [Stenotrophomonas maltophilia]HEL4289416.1 prephenate dehydrogenase [Stenotrophomonas maltophilia]
MTAVQHFAPRTIGIVGSAGAYGRWLGRFFEQQMRLQVIGHDPADAASHTPEQLLAEADVLVFSAPIRHTPELIAEYVRRSAGRERGRLWLDVTSVKDAPVQAMLASQAEVVGLHPMTAPPKAPTLKGRVMVVCEARLQHWQPWLDALCVALQAECVRATPQHHDQMMALVQAMVHATHLAQAGVLREYQPQLGTLEAMLPYRSASFELDTAIISRILSLNPAIYEDIQFGNPHVAPMLERLVGQLRVLQAQVDQGDDMARGAFREQMLVANRAAFGAPALASGNYTFERVGYLLADLTERNAVSVHLPEDRPGSLRELLNIFEQHGISLASIHSSRTPGGEVHFRIGFVAGSDPRALADAAAAVDASGIGRVLA